MRFVSKSHIDSNHRITEFFDRRFSQFEMGGRAANWAKAYCHPGLRPIFTTIGCNFPYNFDFMWFKIAPDRTSFLTKGTITFIHEIRSLCNLNLRTAAMTRKQKHD